MPVIKATKHGESLLLDRACPKCGSKVATQQHYERAIEEEVYHCAKCRVWFSESGLVEVEDADGCWVWKK